jgi:hypothetical protein
LPAFESGVWDFDGGDSAVLGGMKYLFPSTYGWKALISLVPAVGIEPTRPQGTRDFESRASTSSTTPAHHTNGKNVKIKRIIMSVRIHVKKIKENKNVDRGFNLMIF